MLYKLYETSVHFRAVHVSFLWMWSHPGTQLAASSGGATLPSPPAASAVGEQVIPATVRKAAIQKTGGRSQSAARRGNQNSGSAATGFGVSAHVQIHDIPRPPVFWETLVLQAENQ